MHGRLSGIWNKDEMKSDGSEEKGKWKIDRVTNDMLKMAEESLGRGKKIGKDKKKEMRWENKRREAWATEKKM